MPRILVVGATGNVGREVVSQLDATGAQFRVMSRKPEAAARLGCAAAALVAGGLGSDHGDFGLAEVEAMVDGAST